MFLIGSHSCERCDKCGGCRNSCGDCNMTEKARCDKCRKENDELYCNDIDEGYTCVNCLPKCDVCDKNIALYYSSRSGWYADSQVCDNCMKPIIKYKKLWCDPLFYTIVLKEPCPV